MGRWQAGGLRVHIDVAAAMSGVSRWGEVHRSSRGPAFAREEDLTPNAVVGWLYSKAENLTLPSHFVGTFDLLVTAKPPAWFAAEAPAALPSSSPPEAMTCRGDEQGYPFQVVHVERGFERLTLAWLQSHLVRGVGIPYFRVVTRPKIFVLATPALARGLPFEHHC